MTLLTNHEAILCLTPENEQLKKKVADLEATTASFQKKENVFLGATRREKSKRLRAELEKASERAVSAMRQASEALQVKKDLEVSFKGLED